ncbi:TLP18.3/Psb32/MOLO-1 phosphatase superfamily protein [Luteimonas cucumeris]|uniref:TLP18.3/Psb32/MOLO-1 phosphatase superfamily protein n=2 Tax=Luteimonas cucumeris TaxID=985012 RepID=A0A562L4Z6_9GAMM|nr:TLP18.3/Psb32/MOLO-1 phosphatase superfamily protein [Luteimonas cucumeris]
MAMAPMRLLRHLFARSARGLFPPERMQRIAAAIAEGERRHRGEICFAVEAALPAQSVWAGHDAHLRASEVFAQLRVWDTEANNGVLVYLLLADHRIEIVADRGLDPLVSAEQWRGVCLLIEERLKAGEPEDAVVRGVSAISDLLAEHFPRTAGDDDRNELADQPHLL